MTSLANDLPTTTSNAAAKLTKREKRTLLIKEAQMIFQEKFMTESEHRQIQALAHRLPPTSKSAPPPSLFLPDFIPPDRSDQLLRTLATLPKAIQAQRELKEIYFPSLTPQTTDGGGEVRVKAADLQLFMEETWLDRKQAEGYLLKAKGDLQVALDLFVDAAKGDEYYDDDEDDEDLDNQLL